MASSSIKFDIPATYMRGFDLGQQKGLQRLLAYAFTHLPASAFTGAITGTSAALTGALTAASVAVTGDLGSATVTATGAATAASIAVTGAATAATVSATGAVSGLTVTGKPVVTTISGDGAITIADGIVKLTKGSAAAITLAAPSAGQEGTILRIISNSAFAHVITATGLLDDGVTGGSKNTATFGAFAGASIMLCAINLKWSVLNKNVVTVA